MGDIEIIKQLLEGNHLNEQELNRASKLLIMLQLELKRRHE